MAHLVQAAVWTAGLDDWLADSGLIPFQFCKAYALPVGVKGQISTVCPVSYTHLQVYSALLEHVGNSGSSRLVQSIRSAIHADLRNASLSQVADTLNMSPSYISMIFKEKTGQNFKDYLFQTRMNRCV